MSSEGTTISTKLRIDEVLQNASRRFDFDGLDEAVFVNTGDVSWGSFANLSPQLVADLPGQAKKAIRPGDILFSEIRPGNGRFARVTSDHKNFVVSTKFMVLEQTSPLVDPDYLYSYLTSKPMLETLARIAEGRSGTFPQITFDAIGHLELFAPPLPEQRRVAWVLGALDDKIELNRKMAKTLEETAAAIFKARFVDFEGVEEFEDSEIGPIPKGWSVRELVQLASITMGQSPPSSTYSDDPSSGLLLVQGKGAFGKRFPESKVFCDSGSRKASPGDLLLTVRAPVGDINVCDVATCLGRGVAGIRSDFPAFIECALKVCASRWAADESGTIYPAVNKTQVESFKLAVPGVSEVRRAESLLSPLLAQVSTLHRESQPLCSIRDELLPKLISGKIRVPERVGPDVDPGEAVEELVEA